MPINDPPSVLDGDPPDLDILNVLDGPCHQKIGWLVIYDVKHKRDDGSEFWEGPLFRHVYLSKDEAEYEAELLTTDTCYAYTMQVEVHE